MKVYSTDELISLFVDNALPSHLARLLRARLVANGKLCEEFVAFVRQEVEIRAMFRVMKLFGVPAESLFHARARTRNDCDGWSRHNES